MSRPRTKLVDGAVDWEKRAFVRAGSATSLTDIECRLLSCLVEQRQPASARTIAEQVWGTTCTSVFHTTLHRLRAKLEANPSEPMSLVYRHGRGYALVLSRRTLTIGDGRLDFESRTFRRSGVTDLSLSNLECRLLWYLYERGEPASLRELLTQVWRYHPKSRSRSPYVTIHRLRGKIEPEPVEPRHLVAVRGRGYQLICSLRGRDSRTGLSGPVRPRSSEPSAAEPSQLAPRERRVCAGMMRWLRGAPSKVR